MTRRLGFFHTVVLACLVGCTGDDSSDAANPDNGQGGGAAQAGATASSSQGGRAGASLSGKAGAAGHQASAGQSPSGNAGAPPSGGSNGGTAGAGGSAGLAGAGGTAGSPGVAGAAGDTAQGGAATGGGGASAQGGEGGGEQAGAGGASQGGAPQGGAAGQGQQGGAGGEGPQGGNGGQAHQGGAAGDTAQGGAAGDTAQGGTAGSPAQAGAGGDPASGGAGAAGGGPSAGAGGGAGSGGAGPTPVPPNTVLMFVPGEQVYWSEYKVMREGLASLGYNVEVRSSRAGPIAAYMADGDIEQSANSLAGGSYAAFKAQFAARFGGAFQDSWSAPSTITPAGLIGDVTDVSAYAAFVLVGGVGALAYRLDGTYDGPEQASAAAHLDALASQALASGTLMLAQCHAGTLPIFFRRPGTAGSGPDGLGISILSGRSATAYPLADSDTAAQMAAMNVAFDPADPLVVDGPADGPGASRVITSRDWYPQTVAHATSTLAAALRTYPPPAALAKPHKTLIVHGGAVDTGNCSASNRDNDIPCNYGTAPPERIPADHTTLRSLLEADSPADSFTFAVSDVDLSSQSLPFDPSSQPSVRAYLDGFDAVVFFKHWNTHLTPAIYDALSGWVDDGGGLVALHHGLYDDAVGGQSKAALVSLFGASSAMATWSARNPDDGPYAMLSVNLGHFVSTHGIAPSTQATPAPAWLTGQALPNPSPSLYQGFSLIDEIYNNMAFSPGVTFGPGTNQVDALFANNVLSQGTQALTSGFARARDLDGDGTAGRLVYLEPGERRSTFTLPSPSAQVVRNAVVWAAR